MIHSKERPWWLYFDRWALVAFILGAGVLSGANQQRVVGIIMVLAFVVRYQLGSKSQKGRVLNEYPKELACYSLWAVWVGLTGVFVSVSLGLFWLNYRVLLQMVVLLWTVYGLQSIQMSDRLVYTSIIITASILALSGLLGYQLLESGEIVLDSGYSESDRVAGLAGNPNVLGGVLIYAVGCAMALWRKRTSFAGVKKIMLVAFLLFACYITARTGSRKSVLIMALMLAIWVVWLLPKGKGLVGAILRLSALLILVGMVTLLLPLLMEQTITGRRFVEFIDKGHGDVVWAAEENIRYTMYVEGIKMFLTHPIAGVGLGHFVVYFAPGLYSHSDYIEPLATTGGVGFLLYESFYVFLILRIRRVLRVERDADERYLIHVMALTLFGALLLGLGGPHWSSQFLYILLTTFVVYLVRREHELKSMIENPWLQPMQVTPGRVRR